MHVVAENYEQTHIHTHTRDNYNNLHFAHARRGLIQCTLLLILLKLFLGGEFGTMLWIMVSKALNVYNMF